MNTEGYGFTINLDDFVQDGNNRIFEIQTNEESVEKFIADMNLFEEKDDVLLSREFLGL